MQNVHDWKVGLNSKDMIEKWIFIGKVHKQCLNWQFSFQKANNYVGI